MSDRSNQCALLCFCITGSLNIGLWKVCVKTSRGEACSTWDDILGEDVSGKGPHKCTCKFSETGKLFL